jgi:hypothetical protein
MKLTAIALAAGFALSGTAAIANTVHHESTVRLERNAVSMVQLHRDDSRRNGNPGGPTTLSGTGGANGDRDGWPNDMILD